MEDNRIEVIDSNNIIDVPETNLKKKVNGLKIILIVFGILLFILLIGYILLLVLFNFDIKVKDIILDNGSNYQVELIPNIKNNFDINNYVFEIKNPNVATIDKYGNIKSNNIGTTDLIIKYKYSLLSKKIKIEVRDIDINNISYNDNIIIKTNESIRLKPIINNNENIISNLAYESENNNIAKVDTYGNITSINPGTTSINIIGKNNITKKVNVKVESTIKPISKISLTESNISLKKGEKVKLIPVIEPIDATDTNITWTSNSGNAIVDNTGTVLANQFGVAIITAETSNGLKATCTIMVLNTSIQITNISLNKNNIELKVGELFQLKPTIVPDTATIRDITWTSSNENVVTVNNGKVLGKKKGNATITVKTSSNKTDTCNIVIKEKEIMAKSIDLSIDRTILKVGDSLVLRPTILPDNTVNKNIIWKSSDENIISIENGIITAKKEGIGVITAKTSNGKVANSIIYIKNN